MRAHQDPASGFRGASALPAPTGWAGRQGSLRFSVAMVGLTLLVLGILALVVSAARSGEPGTAVVFSAGAFYVAHMVAFSVYSRRLRRGAGRAPTLVDVSAGGRSVRFGYSAWPYDLLVAVLVMSGLVTGLVAVAATTAGVVGVLLAVAFAALAVTVGWFVVMMLRLAPGELVLSPAGIHQRGLTFTLPGAGDGEVELERRIDNLPIVVSDQSYRGALTDIDRDHQTPLRRQITDSIHIASLSDTTGEARHINLLQGKRSAHSPKGAVPDLGPTMSAWRLRRRHRPRCRECRGVSRR